MPQVKFKATAELPQWLHKKGGKRVASYAGQPTLKVVAPVVMQDGDVVEMDDFEAQWAVSIYPENFEIVGE